MNCIWKMYIVSFVFIAVAVNLCDSACTNCTGTCAQLNFPNTNIANIHQNTTINGVSYSSVIYQQALTQCNNCPFTAQYPATTDASVLDNLRSGAFIGVFSCPIAMCVCTDQSNGRRDCYRGTSATQVALFPYRRRGTATIIAIVLQSTLTQQGSSNRISATTFDADESDAYYYNYYFLDYITINHIACVNSTSASTANICPIAAPVRCAIQTTPSTAGTIINTLPTNTATTPTVINLATTATMSPNVTSTTANMQITPTTNIVATSATTKLLSTIATTNQSTTVNTTTTTNVSTITTTPPVNTTTTKGATTTPANLTLAPVCNTINASLTPAQRQAAVNQENSLRSMLAKGLVASPTGNLLPGTNIYQMSYSCSLEATAQAWANNCNFTHSHGPYGENIYIATGRPSSNPLTEAGTDWWSEVNATGLDDPNTTIFDSFDFTAGHFTQMAWGLTTSFGCGFTYCLTSIFGRPATLVVCQYLPAGNFVNEPIYTVGATCTQNSNCNALRSSVCNVTSALCMTT